MIYIYRKDTGEIKMVCEVAPDYDKSIFSQKTLNLSEAKQEEFINADKRYIRDGKLELEARKPDKEAVLKQMSDDLEAMKNGQFTKEELLDKVIELTNIIK